MIKVSLIQNYDLKNKIFDLLDNNRDNYCYFYYKLREEFAHKKMDLSTCDLNIPTKSDVILYHGLNQKFIDYGEEISYLLSIESPHVDTKAFDINNQANFRKIFTWDDWLVDNKKYFKVNYAFKIPQSIPKDFSEKKLCTTIAGNKNSAHPDELYSKRRELIRWFEVNHPLDFDLYGTSWDQRNFGSTLLGRVLNRFSFLKTFNFKAYPSYKGMVDSKFDTFSQYKFAICYENIKNQPGYITEKIFDAFFSGCVPVYWGADNIKEHIPENCFIDQRDFTSYGALYEFMTSMNEEQYLSYLDNIEHFLNSSKADPFRAEVFATTIVNEIVKDLNAVS